MTETFESYRLLLFAIAYRMLGSAMEAEDIVQETYLRYQATPPDEIRSLKAFLSTVTTRLCIDYLKSAKAQREAYFGTWLPEPIRTAQRTEDNADENTLDMFNESLSMAFLVLLEKLNPLERAVFLLREVFEYDFAEIGSMVGKPETACRKALQRARQAIHAEKARFHSTPEEHRTIFSKFIQAYTVGDLTGLVAVLAEDVTIWSDGGGKASAATHPIVGRERVIAFIMGLMRRAPSNITIEFPEINGRMGMVVRRDGVVVVTLLADVEAGQITALRFIRNPDKLQHV
ncbi:MAG: RNA polymerase sigma-70 factor [Anaerolineae bacterium]